VNYTLGVDLGSSFVAAAVASGSRARMVFLGEDAVVTPSVVYEGEDGEVVTGDMAGHRAANSPDRAVGGFKGLLGDRTSVVLAGQPRSVIDLIGMQLRDVLRRVAEAEGGPPEALVLTHPASWGPYRKALFAEVPRRAGWSDVIMTSQPEAVATHYAKARDLPDGAVVAVYDLGGAAFEAAVLGVRPSGVEILGRPEGFERISGAAFDEAVIDLVVGSSLGKLDELDMRDPATVAGLARLRQDCVVAKETLSSDTEAVVPVLLPGRHLEVVVSRSGFEELVRARIDATVASLSRVLGSAGVTPDELSALLLVGGSARIPLVAQRVSESVGHPVTLHAHGKHAAALGAARLGVLAATQGAQAGSADTHPLMPPAPAPAASSGSSARSPRDASTTGPRRYNVPTPTPTPTATPARPTPSDPVPRGQRGALGYESLESARSDPQAPVPRPSPPEPRPSDGASEGEGEWEITGISRRLFFAVVLLASVVVVLVVVFALVMRL
jgi:molecular chaperone DnaK